MLRLVVMIGRDVRRHHRRGACRSGSHPFDFLIPRLLLTERAPSVIVTIFHGTSEALVKIVSMTSLSYRVIDGSHDALTPKNA